MIEKTNAIVLRHYESGNTSRVFIWLTEHRGKIATVLKGSQRPRSTYLGQCDLFYSCELLYYHNDHKELFHTKEVSPLQFRQGLRSNWKSCALASYLSDLMMRIHPEHAPHEYLFHLMEKTLDDLEKDGPSQSLMHWYELHLLEIMGLRPRLHHCVACNKTIEPGFKHHLAIARGGLICDRCQKAHIEKTIQVSKGSINMMEAWLGTTTPSLARRTRCNKQQAHELQDILGRFLEYHFDITLRSRTLAFEMCRKNIKKFLKAV